MRSILIIQTAFLGDVILATPVIAELHRIFPNAQIDILVKKGNEELLANNSKVRSIVTLDKSKNKFSEVIRLIRRFRKANYDLVLNLHRFGSSGLIAGLSGGKNIFGFNKNPFAFLYTKRFKHEIGNGTHEVTRNLALIQEFGSEKIKRPELFPSERDRSIVEPFTKDKLVCLAPASVWSTKQLPPEKWIELINSIEEETKVCLVGATSDFDLCEFIREGSKRKTGVVNLAGKFSILQTAALFAKSQHVYVNDSGPLHIASAMNAPVTAYFCSTVPDFGFGPLSEKFEIKQVNNLPCRPCGLHGHKECPLGHFNCGNQIAI